MYMDLNATQGCLQIFGRHLQCNRGPRKGRKPSVWRCHMSDLRAAAFPAAGPHDVRGPDPDHISRFGALCVIPVLPAASAWLPPLRCPQLPTRRRSSARSAVPDSLLFRLLLCRLSILIENLSLLLTENFPLCGPFGTADTRGRHGAGKKSQPYPPAGGTCGLRCHGWTADPRCGPARKHRARQRQEEACPGPAQGRRVDTSKVTAVRADGSSEFMAGSEAACRERGIKPASPPGVMPGDGDPETDSSAMAEYSTGNVAQQQCITTLSMHSVCVHTRYSELTVQWPEHKL